MLLEAVLRGRIYQVKFLLDNKAENVNKTDENGQTCLMKAIFLGDNLSRTRYKIVKLLLQNGAKVNIADKNKKSALMWASWLGKDELVAVILREGILDLNLNAFDLDGNTALHLAAMKGHVNIVRMLIKELKRFGLDIDRQNSSGMTPMLAAAERGEDVCAKVLMTEGEASLTIRDSRNFLNTKEWAEKRSLSSFSHFIARKTPTPESLSSESPDIASSFDGRVLEAQTSECNTSSVGQNEDERIESRANSLLKQEAQCKGNASMDKNDEVKKTNEPNREAISQLTKRKALQNTACYSQSSDVTICNLFDLYGVQNSHTYRQGFDLASLPPCGFYPEPKQPGETEPEELFDVKSSFGSSDYKISNPALRRKASSILSQDSPGLVRRSSNTTSLREVGRKISMLNAFSGVGAGERRRRITVAQAPSNRSSLSNEFGRRRTSMVESSSRRISMVSAELGGEVSRRSSAGVGLSTAFATTRHRLSVPRFDSLQI